MGLSGEPAVMLHARNKHREQMDPGCAAGAATHGKYETSDNLACQWLGGTALAPSGGQVLDQQPLQADR
jgi:hypothetical protein